MAIFYEIPEHMVLFYLIGYNYAYKRYGEDHIKYPDRVMVGTETCVSERGFKYYEPMSFS